MACFHEVGLAHSEIMITERVRICNAFHMGEI